MSKLTTLLIIALTLPGCAAIFENPVINGVMNNIDVITLPLGIVGTVAGNPVSTYYTTQTIQRLTGSSSASNIDLDTGESTDIESVGK